MLREAIEEATAMGAILAAAPLLATVMRRASRETIIFDTYGGK